MFLSVSSEGGFVRILVLHCLIQHRVDCQHHFDAPSHVFCGARSCSLFGSSPFSGVLGRHRLLCVASLFGNERILIHARMGFGITLLRRVVNRRFLDNWY